MPISKDDLLKACHAEEGAITELSNLIVQVVSEEEDAKIETKGKLLAEALETLLKAQKRDDDDVSIQVKTFVHAFVNAIWLLTCRIEKSSSSTRPALASVIEQVLETAAAAVNSSKQDDADSDDGAVLVLLKTELLKCVGDCKLLQDAGLIGANVDLPKKLRLTNTTVFYRQHKFNLLAEESEGYSKFLYFLSSMSASSQAVTELSLQTLIGTYSLDPNRCLDICIDLLEYELQNEQQEKNAAGVQPSTISSHILQCIRILSTTHKLPQLLGFKIRGRQSKNEEDNNSQKTLLRTMAYLCCSQNHQVVSAVDVVQYLPNYQDDDDDGNETAHWTDQLNAIYTTFIRNEKKRIQALGRISLTASSNDDGEQTKNDNSSVDMEHLQNHFAIQFLHVFLEQYGYDKEVIQPVFEPYWSELAVLFPNTVGAAILDWVSSAVDAWLAQVGSVPPWKSSCDDDSQKSVAATMDNVLGVIAEPLECVRESACIRLRPALYSQLCRLFTAILKNDDTKSAGRNESFLDFLRTFLVPSLSIFNPNPALSTELWKVLKQLPYRTRYSLYRSWRGSGLERAALKTDKPLWLMESELLIGKNARYALKRLSKDTIREQSRAVAKCCHGHPLVVFTTILNQIESYDNLVQVMVDACRFVTPLSLDVLGFCILQRLSGSSGGGVGNRSRLKESGVNVSQWLQSLESFTGAFYRRFPFVEFQGILCYLMQRLKEGHVTELGVLRTLLKTSAGWSFADYAPAASLSATQLDGRAGSTLLKRETMTFGVVEDVNLRASNEVRRVLQTDDIGVSLLILLAQVQHQIVFETSNRPQPVKLIGNLVDTCQAVMAILLDFLTNAADDQSEESRNTTAIVKYAKSMPSLFELCDSYKMDVASAWMLCRPLVRTASRTDEMDCDIGEDVLSAFRTTEKSQTSFKAMLSSSTWTYLSTDLFESFYKNALYDLFYPEDIYASEIARLNRETERLAQKKHAPPPVTVQPGAPPEKSDREELERVQKVAAALSSDSSKQKEHVAAMHEELTAKTSTFFVSDEVSREASMTFLTRCVYPRCMQGPDDAKFCALFVSFLHEKETPGFSTLHFFDSLIITLSRSLFCLTEGEAACASILLVETWKIVSRWRYDETAFEKELCDKVGSFMVVAKEDGDRTPAAITKEEYKNLYNQWHAALGATCIGCLKSSEYMHLRNCLVVLTRMVEVYPTRPGLANKLLQALEPLQDESNTLADIRASAQAYSMQLIKARDEGVWKEEDAATRNARLAKEEAAAAERHKKAEEQMAEIKRDSEKITDEIGVWDSRDRGRGRAGDRPSGGGGPMRDRHEREDRRRTAEDRRNAGIRAPPPPRDPTQHLSSQGDRWQRDRGPASGAYSAIGAEPPVESRRVEQGLRGRQQDEGGHASRNLEGRWQRAADRDSSQGGGGGARKRSRPSSPEQGESRDEPQQQQPKRARTNTEDDGGGDGGGARRRTGHRRRAGSRR